MAVVWRQFWFFSWTSCSLHFASGSSVWWWLRAVLHCLSLGVWHLHSGLSAKFWNSFFRRGKGHPSPFPFQNTARRPRAMGGEFTIIPYPSIFVNRQIAQIIGDKNPEICAFYQLYFLLVYGILIMSRGEAFTERNYPRTLKGVK